VDVSKKYANFTFIDDYVVTVDGDNGFTYKAPWNSIEAGLIFYIVQ